MGKLRKDKERVRVMREKEGMECSPALYLVWQC